MASAAAKGQSVYRVSEHTMCWRQQVVSVLGTAVKLILDRLTGKRAILCVGQVFRPGIADVEGNGGSVVLCQRRLQHVVVLVSPVIVVADRVEDRIRPE